MTDLIKDIAVGKKTSIEGIMNITEKYSEASKKNYLVVNLHDTAGDSIFINVFNSSPFFDKLSNYEFVYGELTFKTSQNGEFTNYNILEFAEKPKPIISPFNIESLKVHFKEHINSIVDVRLRNIIVELFKDKVITTNIFIAPANVDSGYNYECGLLVHITRMLDLLETTVQSLSYFDSFKMEDESLLKLNLDMLKVAVILHDLGKIQSYEQKFKIDKTMDGILFEDSYLSMRIADKLVSNSDLTIEEQQLLLHAVGAAKGSVNFGASHSPRTLEAYVLSFIDKLDYHVALFETMGRNIGETVLAKNNQKQYVLLSFDDVVPEEVKNPPTQSDSKDEDADKNDEDSNQEENSDETSNQETPDSSEGLSEEKTDKSTDDEEKAVTEDLNGVKDESESVGNDEPVEEKTETLEDVFENTDLTNKQEIDYRFKD